jgi:hypothetical protein
MILVASLKTTRAVLKARKSSDTGAATSPSFKSNATLLFRTYTRTEMGHLFFDVSCAVSIAYLISMNELQSEMLQGKELSNKVRHPS